LPPSTARSADRDSKREFIAKLSIVVQECDETLFWLELLIETPLLPPEATSGAIAETGELIAILVASRKTAQHQSGSSCR